MLKLLENFEMFSAPLKKGVAYEGTSRGLSGVFPKNRSRYHFACNRKLSVIAC